MQNKSKLLFEAYKRSGMTGLDKFDCSNVYYVFNA